MIPCAIYASLPFLSDYIFRYLLADPNALISPGQRIWADYSPTVFNGFLLFVDAVFLVAVHRIVERGRPPARIIFHPIGGIEARYFVCLILFVCLPLFVPRHYADTGFPGAYDVTAIADVVVQIGLYANSFTPDLVKSIGMTALWIAGLTVPFLFVLVLSRTATGRRSGIWQDVKESYARMRSSFLAVFAAYIVATAPPFLCRYLMREVSYRIVPSEQGVIFSFYNIWQVSAAFVELIVHLWALTLFAILIAQAAQGLESGKLEQGRDT